MSKNDQATNPIARDFEEYLKNHGGIVGRVVRMFAFRIEDRQDLTQEIKVQLWIAFQKFDSRRSFSTWMYRVALNTAISWYRLSNRKQGKDVPIEQVDLEAPSTELGTESFMLAQVIAQLDPLHRALMLLYLDDLSHTEIGEVLGISPNLVATKLSRLRIRLRNDFDTQKDNYEQ